MYGRMCKLVVCGLPAVSGVVGVIVPSHLLVQPSVRYPAEKRNELAGNEMKRAQIGMDGYDTFRSAPFRL